MLESGGSVSKVNRPIFFKRTSGSLAIIPGVRFKANVCNDLENSESAPSAGCTDRTTLLDRYAILATGSQLFSQPYTRVKPHGEKGGGTQTQEDLPASPTVTTEAMSLEKFAVYKERVFQKNGTALRGRTQ